MNSRTTQRFITACLVILSAAVIASPAASALEDGQKFKDWTARCETARGAEQEICYIFQRLVSRKDEVEEYVQVLHVLVGYITADNKPGMFATVPLGVSIPQGVQISVDGGDAVRFGYNQCSRQGCLGALALSDEMIARMKAGKQALITFYSGAQQPVSLSISLQGFTAGFNALR